IFSRVRHRPVTLAPHPRGPGSLRWPHMMTRRLILGLAAVAALAACKKKNNDSSPTPVEGSGSQMASGTTPKPTGTAAEINGSGSTFNGAFQEAAIEAY